MELDILCFGMIVDIIGSSCIQLQLKAGSATEKIKELLEENYPRLKTIQYVISVNEEVYVDYSREIYKQDSIALLPPFAGG